MFKGRLKGRKGRSRRLNKGRNRGGCRESGKSTRALMTDVCRRPSHGTTGGARSPRRRVFKSSQIGPRLCSVQAVGDGSALEVRISRVPEFKHHRPHKRYHMFMNAAFKGPSSGGGLAGILKGHSGDVIITSKMPEKPAACDRNVKIQTWSHTEHLSAHADHYQTVQAGPDCCSFCSGTHTHTHCPPTPTCINQPPGFVSRFSLTPSQLLLPPLAEWIQFILGPLVSSWFRSRFSNHLVGLQRL